MMENILLSRSEAETEAFAARLAAEVPRGTVILLEGDLGAGKTVFARGFARALGITEPVSSPTYTIVQEYALPGDQRRGRLYHLDLYRIDSAPAALAFGVDEFFDDPDSYTLVEWPHRVDGILPPDAWCVAIRHVSNEERELKLTRPS